MRVCSTCGESKDKADFYKSNRKDGLEPYCKKCRNSWNSKAYLKNKEAWKERTSRTVYFRKYGLTKDEIQEKLDFQGGKCAVCKTDIYLGRKDIKKKAVVDHCHTSGEVRGILCSPCNMALGLLNENQDTLLGAVSYLRKWGK